MVRLLTGTPMHIGPNGRWPARLRSHAADMIAPMTLKAPWHRAVLKVGKSARHVISSWSVADIYNTRYSDIPPERASHAASFTRGRHY